MANWNKTVGMANRLGVDVKKDLYQGRRIIHRDSEIDSGVYLGQGKREAIVVDSKKYPKIKELYEIAKKKATVDGEIKRNKILRAVYETIQEAMPKQDNAAVQDLISKYGAWQDRKITLDVFIEEGVGVCRHDALACAEILELFKKDGYIRGKPSVDRNAMNLGGHAWCRYTNSAGTIYILDVAQRFLGRLEDSKQNEGWDYHRPEDY